jgi:nucleoside-diphosphate-sugar epimerase
MARRTVLVVGASGLVGTGAVEKFLHAGDDVIALSRRAPEVDSSRAFTHLSVDLTDSTACERIASQLSAVTHVVYAAVFELPGLMPGWTDERQMETNLAMMSNVMEPLLQHAKAFRHISFLQGTKAYGAHLHAIRIPARERSPRDNHPNFYWLQEDYIRAKAIEHGFAFTIWRPQLIVGPNYGVVMNPLPVIGAYGAIRAAEGKPFSYPGGARWVWQATDTRVIAEAMEWAADNPLAHNETYNITNGEVFEWRDIWPAMAETLGVDVGPDEPLSLATYLPERSDVWDHIVRDHQLRLLSIEDVCGESHHYTRVCFVEGAIEPPNPKLVSTVKLRQAGFTGAYDTEESMCHWLRVLQHRRVLPKPL